MISKYLLFASVLASCSVAPPLRAEVAEKSDASFVTRATVSVAAEQRAVWLALTKPGEWWSDEHTWSGDAGNMTLVPQAGGCFCERIPGTGDIPMDGSAKHAEVVQSVPDKALRLRGEFGPLQAFPVNGVLTISLKEIDGGTAIGWEYYVGGAMPFDVDRIAPAVDQVMNQQLAGLRDHLGALEDGSDAEDAGSDGSSDSPPETNGKSGSEENPR